MIECMRAVLLLAWIMWVFCAVTQFFFLHRAERDTRVLAVQLGIVTTACLVGLRIVGGAS